MSPVDCGFAAKVVKNIVKMISKFIPLFVRIGDIHIFDAHLKHNFSVQLIGNRTKINLELNYRTKKMEQTRVREIKIQREREKEGETNEIR